MAFFPRSGKPAFLTGFNASCRPWLGSAPGVGDQLGAANPATSSVLCGCTRIAQLEANVAALQLATEHGARLRALLAPLASKGHVEEAPYTFTAPLTPEFITVAGA